jgi:hypothetical protein
MISKIISRAACLRELASNPKSFSNCRDLHGGVPGLARTNRRQSQQRGLGLELRRKRGFQKGETSSLLTLTRQRKAIRRVCGQKADSVL